MSTSAPVQLPPPHPTGLTNALGEVDIRDIKPPVQIPSGWAWLVWTVAILAITSMAWWAWRRWRRKASQPTPEIIVPPHFRAREKLRAALTLIGQPEPFCVLVSGTIRVYLEERFELNAPDRTTEEFLDQLQASSMLSLAQKRGLADFLTRCDLVKFARDEPSEPALRDIYDAAVRLVEETELPSVAPSGTVDAPSQVTTAGLADKT